MTCLAEIWKNGGPDRRCSRRATHAVVTKFGERFAVCWQHARSCRPYGLWIADTTRPWGWVDVSTIVRTEEMTAA